MRIAFTRWRFGGLLNRPSPRKRLLPRKKTSSGFEFVSGLTAGASAMPAKWSRRVFSFTPESHAFAVLGSNDQSNSKGVSHLICHLRNLAGTPLLRPEQLKNSLLPFCYPTR